MSKFLDFLQGILHSITGKYNYDTHHNTENKLPDNSLSNFENNICTNDNLHQQNNNTFICEGDKRDPYFFQIGFDFGTSFSKSIIRDINSNRAWIYTYIDNKGNNSFLIPSVVVFNNGYFERHTDPEVLYPEGGIYHIKMAIEKMATDTSDDSLIDVYNKIFGNDSLYNTHEIARLACIFLLTSIFNDILESITVKFPTYGFNEGDQTSINMAIPVSDMCDKNICSLFESILNISWSLANTNKSIRKHISIVELKKVSDEISHDISNQGSNEMCHVYPEVSANVQAFINSPASSPDECTIYFFSDTGAGTVDQSVFTYAGPNEAKRLNYFAAGVFPRGSSQIERIACGDDINEDKLEYWRKHKENRNKSQEIDRAINKIANELLEDTTKTLRKTSCCLPCGVGGITPESTLREHVKFIFSGGGHIDLPYRTAVIDAYKYFLKINIEPLVTSMACPKDLEIPEGCDHWMNRLHVAYGLSFLFYELAEHTYPHDNVITQNINISDNKTGEHCSCNGFNKNCQKCYGTGIIQ